MSATDLGAKLDLIIKRLDGLEKRVGSLESAGGGSSRRTGGYTGRKAGAGKAKKGGGGGGAPPSGLFRKKSSEEIAADYASKNVTQARMKKYRFGSRSLFVMLPSSGYPTPEEAAREVEGELELVSAYGYNGKELQSRQNLFVTDDGALLYYLAAVGVVNPLDDPTTQRFFFGHNDDITSMDFKKGTTWVATGQVDPKDVPGQGKDMPKIYIWDYKTCEVVKLIANAGWGQIKQLAFAPNSGMLYSIAGDDSQPISAWNTQKWDNKKWGVSCKQDTYREEILGMTVAPEKTSDSKDTVDEILMFGRRKAAYVFVEKVKNKKGKTVLAFTIKNLLTTKAKGASKNAETAYLGAEFLTGTGGRYVLGGSSGAIYVNQGAVSLICLAGAHGGAVGDLVQNGPASFISAGFDGRVKTWKFSGDNYDKSSESDEIKIAGSDFEMGPRAIAVLGDNLYIGSKSNQIVAYNLSSGSAEVIVDGHDDQVWGLACFEDKIATGGYDNALKIWNKDTRALLQTVMLGDTASKCNSVAWSGDGKLLAAGTEESEVFLFGYDGSSATLLDTYVIPPKSKRAAVEAVAYLRFGASSDLLAVAHMDSQTYLFSVGDGKLNRWKKAMTEVAAPTNLQFAAEDAFFKVLTRDYEISHWSINKEKRSTLRVMKIPDPDEVKWDGDPLIAGWDVEGLYQAEWDGTDLNDASMSADGKLIASGDDYGYVRLHNYPAVNRDACRKYMGHSSFVVGIEWTGPGDYLMTCGGNDFAIFQWKLNPVAAAEEQT